jgi:DNA-binding response OmpR family regulator
MTASVPDVGPTPKTVLVIEDEPTIRDVVATALENEGYFVETASNGHDALVKLNNVIPDAILVDIMLPRVDGRQFIRECKAQPATSQIPIIVMSAAYDAMRYAELASLVFLAKPFDIDMLLMLVDDAVSTPAPLGEPPVIAK